MLTQQQINSALFDGARAGSPEGEDLALATRLVDMSLHDIETLRKCRWEPADESASVFYCRGCIQFADELGIPEYAVELLKVSLAERML